MSYAGAVSARKIKVAVLLLSAVLMVAVVCLAIILTVLFVGSLTQSNSVMKGDLQVTYMVITSKTATSEEASGGTMAASCVEYFPNYVLVTGANGTTVLWTIDRLKKFEVSPGKSSAAEH